MTISKKHREDTSLRTTTRIVNKETKFGLKNFNGQKFRSSYEYAFAEYLRVLGVKFEYEEHGEPIRNIADIELHYIPDFYLPEYNLYIEIVNHCDKRLRYKMYFFNKQNRRTRLVVFNKKALRNLFDSKLTLYDIIGYPPEKKKRKK